MSGEGGPSTVTSCFIIICLIALFGILIYFASQKLVGKSPNEVYYGNETLNLSVQNTIIVDPNHIEVVVRRNQGSGKIDGIVFDFKYKDRSGERIIIDRSLGEYEQDIFKIMLITKNTDQVSEVIVTPFFKINGGGMIFGANSTYILE